MRGNVRFVLFVCIFLFGVGALPSFDSFQQTFDPVEVGNSWYFFCLNLGKIPQQNSAANVSVQFYFDEFPTIEDVSIAWNTRNHTDFLTTGGRKIEVLLTLNDVTSVHWDIAQLKSGKFQGFVHSIAPLRSVTFRMNSTRFADVLIENVCGSWHIGIEEIEEVQQAEEAEEVKSILSIGEEPSYTLFEVADEAVDTLDDINIQLNIYAIYIGTLFCFGLLIVSVAVFCAFCVVKCHSATNELDIDWGIEMAPLNSTGEETYVEFAEEFEKSPDRVFVSRNPFDEVFVEKPPRLVGEPESLRSDSASSFGSLEPEELSSPFRYLLRLGISDLLQLMVNGGRTQERNYAQQSPEEF